MKAKQIVFSDYICPFCFFALRRVERLREEDKIEVEWKNYELHPYIPPNGAPKHFLGKAYMDVVEQSIKKIAEIENVELKSTPFIPNSHLALEASEFAKDKGVFEPFHKMVFEAYFLEGNDIGKKETLLSIAGKLKLDTEELSNALDNHLYHTRLEEALREKILYGIIGTPTFIMGKTKLVGLQEYSTLKELITQIKGR